MRTLILLILLSITISCRKSEPNNIVVEPPATNLSKDEVAIGGTVFEPDGRAASGAIVTIDGHQITTDATGRFNYSGTVSNTDRVFIKIAKAGYFAYTKTLVVEKGASVGGYKFRLQAETTAGTFAAATGGSVSKPYCSLAFPANSVVKEDGSAYTGTVSVLMPVNNFSEYNRQFPGDGRALSAAGEKSVLEEWGGMLVKLKGQNGEPLKLSKPVTYSYQIGSNAASAPASVRLYRFDEISGNWLEEGTASLIGKKSFDGSTLNLSYLQWATPHPQAFLKANCRDSKLNNAVGFTFNNFCNVNNSVSTQSGQINSNGACLLYIPADMSGRVSIVSPCSERIALLGSAAIAAGQNAERLYTVDLSPFVTSISGKVENCTFGGINGRAELLLDGVTYKSAVTAGQYAFTLMSCTDANGTLTVYDAANTIVKQNNAFPVARGKAMRAADISTCTNQQTGNITVKIAGNTYTFTVPADSVKFQQTTDYFGNDAVALTASNAAKTQSFYITYLGTNGGMHEIYTLNFAIPGKSYLMTWGLFERGTITATKFKTGSTLIEGTFKSKTHLNYTVSGPNQVVEIEGSFKVTQ